MYPSYHRGLSGGTVGWPECAPLAAKTGFPACDIWLEAAMHAGLDSTLETLRANRLLPAAADMPIDFRGTEQTFLSTLPGLDAMAHFAAQIDCPRMTARLDPSGPLPKPAWRKIQLRRLRAVVEILARHNVRLALEFVGSADIRRWQPHEFIWHMDETLELLYEIGPNAGLLLDSWHWHYSNGTTSDIRAARDRIVHVHINDAPEQPFDQVIDKERLMPGEGVIDLTGFLTTLQDIGYTGAVSVEVFATRLKSLPPEIGAKQGYDATMALLEKGEKGDRHLYLDQRT